MNLRGIKKNHLRREKNCQQMSAARKDLLDVVLFFIGLYIVNWTDVLFDKMMLFMVEELTITNMNHTPKYPRRCLLGSFQFSKTCLANVLDRSIYVGKIRVFFVTEVSKDIFHNTLWVGSEKYRAKAILIHFEVSNIVARACVCVCIHWLI